MGTGRPEETLNRAGGWPSTEGRPDLPRIGEPRYVERASDGREKGQQASTKPPARRHGRTSTVGGEPRHCTMRSGCGEP